MTCDSGARPVGTGRGRCSSAGRRIPPRPSRPGGGPAKATNPGGSLRRGKSETLTYFLATARGQQCYSAIYRGNPTPPPAQPSRPLPPSHPAAPARAPPPAAPVSAAAPAEIVSTARGGADTRGQVPAE